MSVSINEGFFGGAGGGCFAGFADFDGEKGCEYRCPVFPTQAEDCNAVDDDCDGRIDEDLETLKQLEILVDGEGPSQYLLQIFLKEAAQIEHDPQAGPFFFEIIQRKGSNGFGAGNFRALFDSIERQQRQEKRVP